MKRAIATPIGKETKRVDLTAKEITAHKAAEDAWSAGKTSRKADGKIKELEASVSARRIREAVLGNVDSIAFIQNIEDQIVVEREKL